MKALLIVVALAFALPAQAGCGSIGAACSCLNKVAGACAAGDAAGAYSACGIQYDNGSCACDCTPCTGGGPARYDPNFVASLDTATGRVKFTYDVSGADINWTKVIAFRRINPSPTIDVKGGMPGTTSAVFNIGSFIYACDFMVSAGATYSCYDATSQSRTYDPVPFRGRSMTYQMFTFGWCSGSGIGKWNTIGGPFTSSVRIPGGGVAGMW